MNWVDSFFIGIMLDKGNNVNGFEIIKLLSLIVLTMKKEDV